MKIILYRVIQCTWGLFQTTLGFIMLIIHIKDKHYSYHGAIITEWKKSSSVSLGLFVFVSSNPFFARKYRGKISKEECFKRLLVHEYGHTIQSLLLGPLYLIVIGIPSMLWASIGGKKRRANQISYSAFFSESWANTLGEKVTGEKSIGMLVLD